MVRIKIGSIGNLSDGDCHPGGFRRANSSRFEDDLIFGKLQKMGAPSLDPVSKSARNERDTRSADSGTAARSSRIAGECAGLSIICHYENIFDRYSEFVGAGLGHRDFKPLAHERQANEQ